MKTFYIKIIIILVMVSLPYLFLACTPQVNESDEENDSGNSCEELCEKASECSSPCVPEDCTTHCLNDFSQTDFDCLTQSTCEGFNDCLCGSSNDDDDNDNDDDDDDDADDAPFIVSTLPEGADDELRLATVVEVTFSEPMNQLATQGAFVLDDGLKTAVSGIFSWDGLGEIMTFTPDSNLVEDTSYSVTISTGAQDLAGIPLDSPHLFSFETVNLWTRTYNGDANDYDQGSELIVDSNGNVFAIGIITTATEERNIWIMKYDKDGNETLIANYDQGIDSFDLGTGIAFDNNMDLVISGYSDSTSQSHDITYGKYSGTTYSNEWMYTYNYTSNYLDDGYSIAADSNNNIYIAGMTNDPTQGWNIFAMKWDSTGTDDTGGSWPINIDGPASGQDAAMSIATDSSNYLYIAGYENVAGQDANIWINKYNTSGSQTWGSPITVDGPASGNDKAYDVVIHSNDLYVIGYMNMNSGGSDIWFGKYSTSDHTEAWTETINGSNNGDDKGEAIFVDNEGNIYGTGNTNISTQDGAIWIAKYSQNKTSITEEWNDIPTDLGTSGIVEYGAGITVDSIGNVYIIGRVISASDGYDIWVRKYDPDGNWSDD